MIWMKLALRRRRTGFDSGADVFARPRVPIDTFVRAVTGGGMFFDESLVAIASVRFSDSLNSPSWKT